jgi:hypothetical protein
MNTINNLMSSVFGGADAPVAPASVATRPSAKAAPKAKAATRRTGTGSRKTNSPKKSDSDWGKALNIARVEQKKPWPSVLNNDLRKRAKEIIQDNKAKAAPKPQAKSNAVPKPQAKSNAAPKPQAKSKAKVATVRATAPPKSA